MNQYTFVENNPGTNNDPMGDHVYIPEIKNCNQWRKNSLWGFDLEAERWVGTARKYTHKRNKVYKKCGKKEFKKWFGCRGSKKHFRNRRHWAHVETIIRRMNFEFRKGHRHYKCKSDTDSVADAFPLQKYIHINRPFWTIHANHPNFSIRRTRTIVHETSHKKGACMRQKKEVYGEQDCLNRAANNPVRAKENADNYAMFAEERYFGFVHNPK